MNVRFLNTGVQLWQSEFNEDSNRHHSLAPTPAAHWLIRKTQDAYADFDHDQARTERFFLASYQIIKPMFKDELNLSPFILTVKELLDKSDIPWWNDSGQPAASTG